MTKNEKKILLGLYLSNPMVDSDIVYQSSELNWLIQNDLSKANEWRKEGGGFNCIAGEAHNTNWLSEYALRVSTIEKALAYLKGKQYIDYQKRDIDSFKISVTISGCDIARELQSRWGILNLWYQEHKDGLLWFIVTVLTSSVVTLAVNYFDNKDRHLPLSHQINGLPAINTLDKVNMLKQLRDDKLISEKQFQDIYDDILRRTP